MGKLRFLFALWMAKLSIPALKITRHNGTDFPGSLAVKLCPDFLKYIGKPEHIIADILGRAEDKLRELHGRHIGLNHRQHCIRKLLERHRI